MKKTESPFRANDGVWTQFDYALAVPVLCSGLYLVGDKDTHVILDTPSQSPVLAKELGLPVYRGRFVLYCTGMIVHPEIDA